MKTLSRTLLLSAGLFLFGCGDGPIFYAEVEETSACKTLLDVPFEPVTPGSDLRFELPLDLNEYISLLPSTADGFETTVRLIEGTFNAKEGIVDFNQFETASISVEPQEGSEIAPATLIQYERDTANLPGRTMTLGGETSVNLIEYVGADPGRSVHLTARMTGSLPNNVWKADLRVCLHLRARFNYAREFGL